MSSSKCVLSHPLYCKPCSEKIVQMDCNEEDRFQSGSCDKEDGAANFGFSSSKPFITVIDRSGIHEIGINWCHCPEAPKHDLQLMMAGLFPATFHNPKMAFTFWVLEEFHLDNLECKTTPSQFFSHLRRLTNDVFPDTVPVGIFIVSANSRLTGGFRTDIGSFLGSAGTGEHLSPTRDLVLGMEKSIKTSQDQWLYFVHCVHSLE